MQIVDCKVKVAAPANVGPEVEKEGVTPAEIFIYRHIHGPESVFDIRPRAETHRSHAQEKERLKTIFRPTNGKDIVEELFPGYSPRLPVRLKDIGIGPDSQFLRNPRRAAEPPLEPEPEPVADSDEDEMPVAQAPAVDEPAVQAA